MRQGVVVGTTALRRRMLVTLEINNKDKAYEWFLAWMAKQTGEQATKSSRFAPWTRSHQLSVETTVEQRKNGSSSALFKLVAGPGTHYVQYRGAWMQVFKALLFKKPRLADTVTGQTRTGNAFNATYVRNSLGNGDFDYPLKGQESLP